jgi:hypothetical protein
VSDTPQSNEPDGPPPGGWATLGTVLPPQAVPAAPGSFITHNGQLSAVSTATVARLLGKDQAS